MMIERQRIVAALENSLRLIDNELSTSSDAFGDIAEARAALDRFEVGLYDHLRDRGWTWTHFGNIFGISKQSAFRRYRRLTA